MTEQDRPSLAEILLVLGETFNEPISEIRAQAYFDALADLSLEDVKRAARAIIQTSRFFPKPVDLRDQIERSSWDEAELMWMQVVSDVRRMGSWRTPSLTTNTRATIEKLWGSWQQLCETLPSEGPELLGWAKQFKIAYRIIAEERVRQYLPPTPTRGELA